MKRQALLVLATAASAVACQGFKDAMTAHVDVVAKAGTQELGVDRLGDMLGKSQLPLRPEVVRSVTNLWVDYQLLALAAAKNDSLNKPATIDSAMGAIMDAMKARKWYQTVSASWATPGDVAAAQQMYNQGDVLAARHILIRVDNGATPQQVAAARARAETIRAQANAGNFAQLAKQNSQDPGSAAQGGALPVFHKGEMVPEFERAVLALQPGQISPVVQTSFGFHIIRRSTFDEVKDQVIATAGARTRAAAESTYFANLEKASDVQVKSDAPKTLKAIATDLDAHLNDKTVIASYKGGALTAARMARLISDQPQRDQLRDQIQQAPDSLIPNLVKNVVRTELFIRQADSAKVGVDTAELGQMHKQFAAFVIAAWQQLGIDPKMLADSAKTESAREHLASDQVDAFLDRLFLGQGQFVQVPPQVESVLRQHFSWDVSSNGVQRALDRATKVRASADSARRASQPASEVPLPIAPAPGQQPAQQKPAQQPPATKQP